MTAGWVMFSGRRAPKILRMVSPEWEAQRSHFRDCSKLARSAPGHSARCAGCFFWVKRVRYFVL